MALAWPAAAQATDYGGGTAPDSRSRTARQLTLVGIRTTDSGRAQIRVGVSARCGISRLRHTVPLNPDGTFAFDVNVRPPPARQPERAPASADRDVRAGHRGDGERRRPARGSCSGAAAA